MTDIDYHLKKASMYSQVQQMVNSKSLQSYKINNWLKDFGN